MVNKSICSIRKIVFICVFAAVALTVLTILCIGTAKSNKSQAKDGAETKIIPPQYPLVIIDAGHGGEDGGAIGINGELEKSINLSVALKLEQMLNSVGVTTLLTRSDDTLLYDKNSDYQGRKKALDMQARLNIANQYTDAVFISIHMNSFSQAQYSGLQVYYSENNPFSHSLAQTVQQKVKQTLQPNNNRNIKPSNGNIYLLEKIFLPCVLIECGFISNPQECEALCDEDYQNRLAISLCDGILNYFKTYCNNPSDNS